MEYDTVCPMYKREHRRQHFGVGLLGLPRENWFSSGLGASKNNCFTLPADGATVPLLLVTKKFLQCTRVTNFPFLLRSFPVVVFFKKKNRF